jgi:hypothetical protein
MKVPKNEKQRDYALYAKYCLEQVASAPDQEYLESCCAKWPPSGSIWPTARTRKTRWWPHRRMAEPTDTPKPDRSLVGRAWAAVQVGAIELPMLLLVQSGHFIPTHSRCMLLTRTGSGGLTRLQAMPCTGVDTPFRYWRRGMAC